MHEPGFQNPNVAIGRDGLKKLDAEPEDEQQRITQQAALEHARYQAKVIQEVAFPAAMATALKLEQFGGPEGFKVYRDQLLEQCGRPTDPIEIMLIEQIALAHHRIARLHAAAAEASTIEQVKAYSAAAARLTGEFRRLALSLRTYRQPVSTKHFTVVRQQNVSSGNQQIAYVDQHDSQTKVPSASRDTELRSKTPEALEYAPQTDFRTQSAASGRWEEEPLEAQRIDERRA